MIWSPLAPVTYFVPCIGHIAIADSQGNAYDFQGTHVIGKNNLLFGYPTKIIQMADPGIDDEVWDNTLKQSILRYQGETYNFLYYCFIFIIIIGQTTAMILRHVL